MSDSSRVRSATWEDLERDFGSAGLVIGIPVRPPVEEAPPPAELPPVDENDTSL